VSVHRRYELRVVAEFAAAHVLRGYAGACDRVHGHNFKVEAEVVAEGLDPIGMGLDFHEVERLLHGALAPLDHRMLNELPAFRDRNPTAEAIAEHVFARLSAALADRAGAGLIRLSAITVRENDRFSVRYSETPQAATGAAPSAQSQGQRQGHTSAGSAGTDGGRGDA
jgi:6-pyruvoyltetrahydropterin/6-carboxytetrahydropterin synthase